ncbi:MAG: SDR family oxidoreductase [Pseudomonadales bacterium]
MRWLPGASGIGLAISTRLVEEGARVVIGDINPESLRAAAISFGGAVVTQPVDVRVEGEVEALVAAAESLGGLTLGFNCAGLGAFGEIAELSEADWDTVIDICLKGVFLSLKHQARAMRRSGRSGAIVNIASLNARVPMYGGGAYAAAKAGVEMLTRNAALELAADRIRVNTVSPGLTDTPLTAGFRDLQGAEAAFMARIPMARWGSPRDMAAAALFLASEDAGYITGSNLVVDGGWETTGYPDLKPWREAFRAPGA